MDLDSSIQAHGSRTTPEQTGKRKAREFLDEMAIETPKKSRRLVLATEIAKLERDREKVHARIRKDKERVRDLLAKIEADEILKARLDDDIRCRKTETLSFEWRSTLFAVTFSCT